eukprot:CAMPEP_0114502786 /NCGR_PEP_ID=MMETSP0109-20121206/9293_1 /TAXON_ID=29199 /ORGANISM="Chlorarachnion reptans, Strain CCCM449" /LENGTH=205 /DNA_ID=CAMNT_0001680757 /DNA_START=39 /DNA_END=656 /DNA_ORIENTATION=+
MKRQPTRTPRKNTTSWIRGLDREFPGPGSYIVRNARRIPGGVVTPKRSTFTRRPKPKEDKRDWVASPAFGHKVKGANVLMRAPPAGIMSEQQHRKKIETATKLRELMNKIREEDDKLSSASAVAKIRELSRRQPMDPPSIVPRRKRTIRPAAKGIASFESESLARIRQSKGVVRWHKPSDGINEHQQRAQMLRRYKQRGRSNAKT